jgi:hypothetical protein
VCVCVAFVSNTVGVIVIINNTFDTSKKGSPFISSSVHSYTSLSEELLSPREVIQASSSLPRNRR